MTSFSSSMGLLDQWDLAPGEAISQNPPSRSIKRSRDLPCPPPTLDTEQFILDGAFSLNNDSSSLSSLHEYNLAPGEVFSQTPPGGSRRCPTPPCPPPTLDTQEFFNDHPEVEDAWLADDSEEVLEDVPDSLDGMSCESTEETTNSTGQSRSRLTLASPVPPPAKKRILLTPCLIHNRQDPPHVDKVESPVGHHNIICETVIPNLELKARIVNLPQKEVASSDSFHLPEDAHLAIPPPGLSSENSTFRQPGQGPLCEPSPSKGCGNKDKPGEREGIEKSPHGSDRRPNVSVQLSPNLYRKSSVTRSTHDRSETSSDKENIRVVGKLHSDMTRPAAARREPLINISNGEQPEDVTLGATSSESLDPEPKAKKQKSLDAYPAMHAKAGRDCDFSSKDTGWRNPRARRKFVHAAKQVSLDRWLG